jgi:uncharacterized membrane protein
MLVRSAEKWGIPIVFVSVVGYGMISGLLFYERHILHRMEDIHITVFGLALIGSLYFAYLTYVEVAIIQAIYPYCLISAIAMVAMLMMSILRLHDEVMR